MTASHPGAGAHPGSPRTLAVVTSDTGAPDGSADDLVSDDLVGDDPDSTAEGMPRPPLDGITDDTPGDGDGWQRWTIDDDEPGGADDEPFELPEIVPATVEPPSEPEPASASVPAPAERSGSAAPAVPQPEPSWRAYVPAVTTATVSAPQPAALRAPGRRPRVRRVTRVVRHVDPWSVFKIGLIFSLVAYVSVLTSGVLLWRVAEATGTVDNIERWFLQFGWETFELDGDEIFDQAWVIGLFGVVAMTGGLVLLATLFNLVSDIVGGIRVTVLEEEVVERTLSSTRKFVVRRNPPATTNGAAPSDWNVDDEPATSPVPRRPVSVPGDWSVDD